MLDAEGLDAVSMRRLAEELDTGPASLYWHVGSKDGLLDLVLDAIIGEQHVPDPEPERWQEQLKEVARTMRAMKYLPGESGGMTSSNSQPNRPL